MQARNTFVRTIPALALCALAATPATAQTGALDQQSPFHLDGLDVSSATGFGRQQDVVVNVAGTLEGVTLRAASPVAGDSAKFQIYLGPGPHLIGGPGQPGEVPRVTKQLVTNSSRPTEIFVDLSASNIQLAAGDVFTIVVQATSQAMTLSYNSAFAQPLYGPQAYWEQPNGQYAPVPVDRLGFETYVLTSAPTLSVDGQCPGPMQLTLTNMSPNAQAAIGASLGTGSTLITGGPCAGTTLDLATPQLIALVSTDAAGTATLTGSMPPQIACGSLTLQAVDVATCATTNTVVR